MKILAQQIYLAASFLAPIIDQQAGYSTGNTNCCTVSQSREITYRDTQLKRLHHRLHTKRLRVLQAWINILMSDLGGSGIL